MLRSSKANVFEVQKIDRLANNVLQMFADRVNKGDTIMNYNNRVSTFYSRCYILVKKVEVSPISAFGNCTTRTHFGPYC